MKPFKTIYLAAPDFIGELRKELTDVTFMQDRLIFTATDPQETVWAQDVWLNPRVVPIVSISDAVKKLRALGKHWVLFSIAQHRRARLIQEQLPKFKSTRLEFPLKKDLPTLGVWTLLDANTVVASPTHLKPVPNGIMEFVENKTVPPTRAYLKLWEALTLLRKYPTTGQTCLDLGSSPGGWTWVLQSLGANVISVDKADLDSKIAKLPRVTHRQESAFGLNPTDIGKVDWLCCDVICYPERLYTLVTRWLDSGLCQNFICTIKLQGDTDFTVIQKFKDIPGSRVLHLYHNKHELTWMHVADSEITKNYFFVT